MKNKKIILPFIYDAMTSFPFIEKDFDALTEYEFQCFMVKKLNELIKAYNDLDTEDVIKDTLNTWLEDGTLKNIIIESYSEFISSAGLMPKTVRGNVLLNIFHDGINLQGGCCIGDNKIVVYCPTATNNGYLECYNYVTKEKLWSYVIQGYHGNTLSFDGDKRIYITACIDQTDPDETLLPYIIVVNLDDPSTVEEIITLPFPSYSTVIYKGLFYTLENRDFTPNIADKVTVSDLEGNVVRTFLLKDYVSVVGGRRTQGLSCIVNDIMYITDHNTRTIFGYDLQGNLVYSGQIEQVMNCYRWIGELEFITYDSGKWLIGSVVISTGEHNIRLGTVAEVGLYTEITITEKKPDGVTSASPRALDTLVVVTNSHQLDPEQQYPHWVATVDDAVNLLKSYNIVGRIRIDHDENYNGLAYGFTNFTGRVYGTDIPVYNVLSNNCNMTFSGLDFSDSVAVSRLISGTQTVSSNMFIVRSKVECLNFSNVTDKSAYISYSDVMISNANINVNRLTWSKLGTPSNWTGQLTDSEPFRYYQYTIL